MSKTYLKSPKLSPGDTIGLVAPSSPTHPDVLPRIKQGLDSLGYKYKCPLDSGKYYGKNDHLFSSDSAENRANAVNSLISDDDVSALWAIRGGSGAYEVLPKIDFRAIRHNPKLIIGFSDITAILLAVMTESDVCSVHAPSLSSLFPQDATNETEASAKRCFDFLQGSNSQPFSDCELVTVNKGEETEGILFGGNLSILTGLLGTSYFPPVDNFILFLEDVGLSPYVVYRHLLQLELAGVFDKVKGVVLGSFSNCVHKNNLGPTLDEVFTSFFSDTDILVVKDAPIGHQGLNYPIPLGVTAQLNLKSLELVDSPILS